MARCHLTEKCLHLLVKSIAWSILGNSIDVQSKNGVVDLSEQYLLCVRPSSDYVDAMSCGFFLKQTFGWWL